MTLTFLKKIKIVIEAVCGKLDIMEGEIGKQNARISSLQSQVEEMKTNQQDSRVLLEEILFAVSQSNESSNILQTADENPAAMDNLNVENKLPYDVN